MNPRPPVDSCRVLGAVWLATLCEVRYLSAPDRRADRQHDGPAWLGMGGRMNLLREAIKAWPRHDLASKQQTKTLRLGYIKARRILGDRYLLAIPLLRKDLVQ